MFDYPEHDRLVEECDYETKLAVTAWVLTHVLKHAKEGGSFRGLIYERLGFGPDAYAPLCLAGGLVISNEFKIDRHREIVRIVQEQKIEPLKAALGLCDEPECFKEATGGYPTESSYRLTCNEHSKLFSRDDHE